MIGVKKKNNGILKRHLVKFIVEMVGLSRDIMLQFIYYLRIKCIIIIYNIIFIMILWQAYRLHANEICHWTNNEFEYYK